MIRSLGLSGILLLLLLAHETSTAQKLTRVKDVVLREDSAVRHFTSAVYDAYLGKLTSGQNFSRAVRVYLRRHTLDDSLGFDVRIESGEGYVMTYDGVRWLSMSPTKRSIVDLSRTGHFRDFLQGNITGNALDQFVMQRPEGIREISSLQFDEMASLEGIVLHDGRPAYSLRMIPGAGSGAPEELFTNISQRQLYDSASGFLLSRVLNAEVGGMPYADTLRLTNLQVDLPLHDSLFTIIPAEGWSFETAEPRPAEDRPTLLAVGSRAPDWSLTDLKGRPVSLRSLRGRVVVLDFWYSTCGPCLMAMPALQRLQKKYGRKGVEVIGVNVNDNADVAGRVMTARKLDYTVVLDGAPVAEEYHVSGYPTLYVIDRKGRIIHASSGYGEDMEAELAAEIGRALKEK